MAPSTLLASAVPRIGVAVFILHPTSNAHLPHMPFHLAYKFLLGRRLGSHGSNTWALPGGHLEFGESFEECAIRETREETDLEIESVQYLTTTNDVMPFGGGGGGGGNNEAGNGQDEKKILHYATIFMVAKVKAGSKARRQSQDLMPEAKIMEPHKCAEWEWVHWEQLATWGHAQARKERSQGLEESREGNNEAQDGNQANRQLFAPMVNLLLQRPRAIPRLDL